MRLSSYLNNPIFSKTLLRAKDLLSNRFRLVALLNHLGKKIDSIEDGRKISVDVKEKIYLFARLLKAVTSGKYKALPWKAAISLLATILYFINPADIIPDFIPLTGLLDDFSILIWTYNSLQAELDKFHEWENANLSS